MTPRVVLVTGVSRYLSARLARTLGEIPGVERVIGVDAVPPHREVREQLEFVRADIRNPLIGKVIASAAVDTVVHMNVRATPLEAGGRSAMKEMNVIGTMQLLAACQQAASVRRLVVKSTTAVYGSTARDPAVFTEAMEPKGSTSTGYAKDALEVEGYVRGFARRRPDVDLTILRLTNVVGPHADSVLTEYFSMPVIPTALGFDARLQLLHEDDAVAVLRRAALGAPPGVYNVGADGVLLLSQAVRRAGRLGVPVPRIAARTVDRLARQTRRLDYTPEQRRFLLHGRVVDTTRLHQRFGYTPRYSTVEAFDDFVRARLTPTLDPRRVAAAERRIGTAVRRVGRLAGA